MFASSLQFPSFACALHSVSMTSFQQHQWVFYMILLLSPRCSTLLKNDLWGLMGKIVCIV